MDSVYRSHPKEVHYARFEVITAKKKKPLRPGPECDELKWIPVWVNVRMSLGMIATGHRFETVSDAGASPATGNWIRRFAPTTGQNRSWDLTDQVIPSKSASDRSERGADRSKVLNESAINVTKNGILRHSLLNSTQSHEDILGNGGGDFHAY
jgi:hypothetical protein